MGFCWFGEGESIERSCASMCEVILFISSADA